MTELGDRLRSMAVLADAHPEWIGVAFVACLDDVSTWTSSEVKGDSAAKIVETLRMTIGWDEEERRVGE